MCLDNVLQSREDMVQKSKIPPKALSSVHITFVTIWLSTAGGMHHVNFLTLMWAGLPS